VGITHQLTIVVEQGTFTTLLYVLALISINLGLLNLLPFPILDGGHLLFLAIEKIKGSPVDVRVQEWAMNIAFFLILFLAVLVTFNDIRRLIR
jgi:regulator of sigma E protease